MPPPLTEDRLAGVLAVADAARTLAAAITAALRSGESPETLATVTGLSRSTVLSMTGSPDSHGPGSGTLPDPWSRKSGQRLLAVLTIPRVARRAASPEGVSWHTLLREFKILTPKGSHAVAPTMLNNALDRALAHPDSGLRVLNPDRDPETGGPRMFGFTTQADVLAPEDPPMSLADAAAARLAARLDRQEAAEFGQPADSAPPPQPRRMTMEERLAAHEAEFGTD